MKNFIAESLRQTFPKVWDVLYFIYKEKKFCNLKNPSTFNEKLMWLNWNCYRKNKLVIQCLDKNLVRKYVAEKGCEEILIPQYKTFASIDEIKYEELPDSFVLKRSWGCGDVFICFQKNEHTISKLANAKARWKRMSQYDRSTCKRLGISRKDLDVTYVCEEYLSSLKTTPDDYKFYCFNGTPMCVLVVSERYGDTSYACMFDTNWQELTVTDYQGFKKSSEFKKPENFEKMCEYAKVLSQDFPFARIDLYNVEGKIYFGEITLLPSQHPIQCDNINGKILGELLELPL